MQLLEFCPEIYMHIIMKNHVILNLQGFIPFDRVFESKLFRNQTRKKT